MDGVCHLEGTYKGCASERHAIHHYCGWAIPEVATVDGDVMVFVQETCANLVSLPLDAGFQVGKIDI
jgi:hypothetical protein